MRSETISRNYAEAFLSLATKAGELEGWGRMLDDVADAMRRDPKLRAFLESPKIDASTKNEVLGKAFQDRLPRVFVRYLQAIVKRGRQALIPDIAVAYRALLEEKAGRVHAMVTLARQPDAAGEAALAAQLSKALGKTVVPHVKVDAGILGGVVVRVGDRVMDGSVRKRLNTLRAKLTSN